MKEYSSLKIIAGKIEGMLTEKEALLLYLLARDGPGNGAIVEIGSYQGKSTACLALGSKKSRREKVYAVDWHRGWKKSVKGGTFGAFSRNMKKSGVADYVIPIVMKSEDAVKKWKKPIRLLWIDGSHDYEDVKKDLLLWGRHLVKGGIVALHDSFWEGPYRVIKNYVLKSDGFSNVRLVDYITFAVKSPPDHKEKMRNMKIALTMRMLKYPMRSENLQPKNINRFIKNMFLNDLPEKV